MSTWSFENYSKKQTYTLVDFSKITFLNVDLKNCFPECGGFSIKRIYQFLIFEEYILPKVWLFSKIWNFLITPARNTCFKYCKFQNILRKFSKITLNFSIFKYWSLSHFPTNLPVCICHYRNFEKLFKTINYNISQIKITEYFK